MRPSFAPAALLEVRAWEYALRFLFGGAVTVCTGLVAHRFGPSVGGLFLAFPAILPATLTLVKEHDGRACAADDARGACLGSIGLAAFAAVVWFAADAWSPVVVLSLATLAWLAVSVCTWIAAFGRRARARAHHAAREVRRARRISR